MGAEVDRLEVAVEAQAKGAQSQLDRLVGKLNNVAKSLDNIHVGNLRNVAKEIGRVSAAANSFGKIHIPNLSRTITQLEQLSKINLKNLEDKKIKIGVEITGGDQVERLKYAVEKSLDDIKIDGSKLSRQLSDAFQLKGSASAKMKAQVDELTSALAASFDGKNFHMTDNVDAAMEQMAAHILENGKVVKANLGSTLSGVEQEYEDFYNYFKNKRIYVSDMLKNDVGKSEYKDILQNNLGNITVDPAKGINLNKNWEELSQRFPTLIPAETVNAADQLVSVLENLKQVRDSIKPISIQDLTGDAKSAASNDVWGQVSDASTRIADNLQNNIRNVMDAAKDKLNLDVNINEDKIVRDIKNAINRASQAEYEPVKVKLSIDAKSIQDAISSKLNGLNTDAISRSASAIGSLSTALGSLGSINVPNLAGLDAFAASIGKLGYKSVTSATQNLPVIAAHLSTFIQSMNSVGSVAFDVSGLDRLLASIGKLGGTKATQATKNLPEVGKNLTDFIRELGQIKSIDFDLTGLSGLVSSINKLGGKSATTAIPNIQALTSALMKMMAELSKAPRVSSNLIGMTNAMANLASKGSRVGSAANSLTSAFGRYGSAADRAGKKTKSFASMIGTLYAKFWMLKRAFSWLTGGVDSSMKFLETVNYFEVAMKDIGDKSAAGWKEAGYDSAESYADSFSKRSKQLTEKMSGFSIDENGNAASTGKMSLGIDPDKLMNYQAMFAQMSSSIGMTGETALNASKAFTMLGADWASLRNISFDTAWEKMASALSGQSRAVRSLGIDITNTNLQQYAYKYGLSQAVSEMNQATKAQLRLLAILDQSEVAFGDLANTISSPGNQIRLLQQNFTNLARTIGNLFLPIVAKVLPYVNGLVIAIQRLFQWIGGLLGISFESINSGMGGMNDSIGDLTGDMGDVADGAGGVADNLNNANQAAKKLKKTVLSFDELNQLNDNSKDNTGAGGTGGAGGGVGGMGGSALLDDAIADALAEYEKKWNEAFSKMENKAQSFADNISDAFKKIWDYAEPTRIAVKKLWDEGLSKFGNFAWTALKDFYNEFLVPIGKWTLGTGLPMLVNSLNNFLNKIDWKAINESLKNFWRALEPFAEKVGEGIIEFYDDMLSVGARFINAVVPGGLDKLSRVLKKIKPNDAKKIGYSLGIVASGIAAFKMLSPTVKILGNIADSLKKWNTLKETFSWLGGVKYVGIAAGIAGVIVALDKFGYIDVDWDKLWHGIENLVSAVGKFVVGIGNGIIDFLTAISAIAMPVIETGINGIVTAFDLFATALNAIPSGVIETITTALLGFFAAWGTYEVAVKIGEIATHLYNFKDAFLLLGKVEIDNIKDKIAGFFSSVAAHPYAAIAAGVAAVSAAVVAAVKDIEKEAEEKRIESMWSTFESSGENAVGKLAENFSMYAGQISESMDAIKEKISSVDETHESIENTSEKIDGIKTAIENGAYTAEEKVTEITSAFQQLLTDSTDIFNEEYDVIVEGLAGGLNDTLTAAGVSVPELTTLLRKIRDDGVESVSGLNEELSNLQTSFNNGEITADEYYLKQSELFEKLNGLTISTQPVDNAKKAFEELKGRTNFSEWVKDGSLDNTAVDTFLDGMGQSFSTAETDINTSIDGTKTALEDFSTYAQSLDYSDTDIQHISEAIAGTEAQRTQQITDLQDYFGEVSGTIQDDLLGKIPELVEKAKSDYKNQSWIYKMFNSESDYIEDTVSDYKANVIDPVNGKIQGKYEELGVDGNAYASDAAKNIIDGLFDVDTEYLAEGVVSQTKTLKENVETVVDNATKDAKGKAEGDGKDIGKNYSIGIGDGISENDYKATDAVTEMTDAIKSTTQTELDEHSPSRISYGYGKNYIIGLANGVLENVEIALSKLRGFYSSCKAVFSNSETDFSDIGNAMAASLTSGLEAALPNVENTVRAIRIDLLSGFRDSYKSLYTIGRNMMVNFSNGMQSVHIKTPHISMSFTTEQSGNSVYTSSRSSVNWYKNGGFPDGEIWGMNEAGNPEMVGRIGSRTAVANNAIIAESIKAAVVDGFMEAFMATSSGKEEQAQTLYVEVKTENDEVLARAVTRGQKKIERRMKP